MVAFLYKTLNGKTVMTRCAFGFSYDSGELILQHFHLPLMICRGPLHTWAHAVDSCPRVRAPCTRVRTRVRTRLSVRADVGRDEPFVRAREGPRRKEPPVKERREHVLPEVVANMEVEEEADPLGSDS